MEQDDLVDTGLDAYNLRVMAILSGLVTAVTWFIVMLLMLDDQPHRTWRLWLEVLAFTATIASAALAVCATVKVGERGSAGAGDRAGSRDERPRPPLLVRPRLPVRLADLEVGPQRPAAA
jgi:hypothetical protein